MAAIPGRSQMETRTVGEWRAWAEQRLINADSLVQRLRGDARQAAQLASRYRCSACTVSVSVPVRGNRYVWEGAWTQHELTCPLA